MDYTKNMQINVLLVQRASLSHRFSRVDIFFRSIALQKKPQCGFWLPFCSKKYHTDTVTAMDCHKSCKIIRYNFRFRLTSAIKTHMKLGFVHFQKLHERRRENKAIDAIDTNIISAIILSSF